MASESKLRYLSQAGRAMRGGGASFGGTYVGGMERGERVIGPLNGEIGTQGRFRSHDYRSAGTMQKLQDFS